MSYSSKADQYYSSADPYGDESIDITGSETSLDEGVEITALPNLPTFASPNQGEKDPHEPSEGEVLLSPNQGYKLSWQDGKPALDFDNGVFRDLKDKGLTSYGEPHGAVTRAGTYNSVDQPTVRHGHTRKIILITIACAFVPILLGTLFLISVDFGAPNSYKIPGYYVRSDLDGIFSAAFVNPLLIASVTSTFISALPPIVLGLLAFHLGHQWIHASGLKSTGKNGQLPTPYQHSLLLRMASSATDWAMFTFLRYWIFRTPGSKTTRLRRRTRARIPFMLAVAAITLGAVLLLSYAIKIVDIILHYEFSSGIVVVPYPDPDYFGSYQLATQCANGPFSTGCAIKDRASLGFQAAANLSDLFRTYPMGNVREDAPNLALMAIPPIIPSYESNDNTDFYANSYGVSTTCSVFRPTCVITPNRTIVSCSPLNASVDDTFNATVLNEGLSSNIQLFLAPDDKRAADLPDVGGTATSINPHRLFGWQCFPSYANIQYNTTSTESAFVNYWDMAAGSSYYLGQGTGNVPNLLCSLMSCNITVLSLQYKYINNFMSVIPSSLAHADDAVVKTFTDVLPYPYYTESNGPGSTAGEQVNSGQYQFSAQYIDAQLQQAVTTAGNVFGNDTKVAFPNAVAQSISELLVSWSSGSIISTHAVNATYNDRQIGIMVPIVWSWIFASLLFVYAFLIVVLGVSCLFIPTIYSVTDKTVIKDGRQHRIAVPQVDIARLRFTDVSTVVHELVPPDGHSSRLDPGEMFEEGRVQRSQTFNSFVTNDSTDSTKLRRRRTRAERELKTVLVENPMTGELNLTIQGR